MVGDLRYCIVLLFIMCTLSGDRNNLSIIFFEESAASKKFDCPKSSIRRESRFIEIFYQSKILMGRLVDKLMSSTCQTSQLTEILDLSKQSFRNNLGIIAFDKLAASKSFSIRKIGFSYYISAILSQTENPDQNGNAWYLPRSERAISSESEIFVDGFLIFISMLIILQVLIPVSLYVTLEIVKLGQVSSFL